MVEKSKLASFLFRPTRRRSRHCSTIGGQSGVCHESGEKMPFSCNGSPVAGAGSVTPEDYGNEGGYSFSGREGNANAILHDQANATNGLYYIFVKARASSGTVFPNAAYTSASGSFQHLT